MRQPLYLLNELRRAVVLKSLKEVCSCRGWTLLALMFGQIMCTL